MRATTPLFPARVDFASGSTVKMIDRTGGYIYVDASTGIPAGQKVKVGDYWWVEETLPKVWMLRQKIQENTTLSHTQFAVRLSLSDCIGVEDSIVSDVVSMGCEEIWVDAAGAGTIFWQGDDIDNLVRGGGNSLQTLLTKAHSKGLKVHVGISMKLFADGNTSLVAQVDDTSITDYISPLAGLDLVKQLSLEAVDLGADGIVLTDIGYALRGADVSAAVVADYFSKYGIAPPTPFAAVTSSWVTWQDYREGLWQNLVSAVGASLTSDSNVASPSDSAIDSQVKAQTSSVSPLTIVIDDSVYRSVSPLDAAVPSSFSCNRFCVDASDLITLGAAKLHAGIAESIAKRSLSHKAVSISGTLAPALIPMLVSDGFDVVCVADYLTMTAQEKLAVSTAIEASGSFQTDARPCVAFVVSQNTRLNGYDVTQDIEAIANEHINSSAYSMKVLMDEDLDDLSAEASRALLLFGVKSLTDAAVFEIEAWLGRQDKAVVAFGVVGDVVGDDNSSRTPPLWDSFGVAWDGTETSVSSLTIVDSAPFAPGTTLTFSSFSNYAVTGGTSNFTDSDYLLLISGNDVLSSATIHEGVSSSSVNDFIWRAIAYSVGGNS